MAFAASDKVYIFGSVLCTPSQVLGTPLHYHGISGFGLGVEDIISVSLKVTITGFVGAFVTKFGELYTWGRGAEGCLGHGDTANQSKPKLVEALNGVLCKQVSCGGKYTAVVTESGKVYEFGEDLYSSRENVRKTKSLPTLVQALETIDIKEVKCDLGFAVALSTSGYVYSWGNFGELPIHPPGLVEALCEHKVVRISCSSFRFKHFAVLVDPSPCPIREAQKAQFNNKDHSDVTFMVDNQLIYGSIDTLSRKSKYFEAMFRSKMKESIEGVVVVPDVSAIVYVKLLEYLCLDDFVLDDLDEPSKEELCELADMYMLDGLRLLLNREAAVYY